MIALQSLVWTLAALALWTTAIAYWVITTCGLNSRRVVLQADKAPLGILGEERCVPLTGIRPGVITPVLATFEVQTADVSFAVVATRDNVSAEEHWRLRKLLVENI